jgi:hypothetical protein
MFREKITSCDVPLPTSRCPQISIKSPGFISTVPVIEMGVMSEVLFTLIKVAVSSNEFKGFPFFTMKKAKKLPVVPPLADMDALI